jgi:hypothetical protein
MPNPRPFLRPALDAMLAAAQRARAARGHPFLARENIGPRGMDFPGASAMPGAPRPSVLTREQEFQAGRVRLPGAPEPGMPPGGFLRPINPPPLAGGSGAMQLGDTRELREGFKLAYARAGVRGLQQPAHEFELSSPDGAMRLLRIVEARGRAGVGYATIQYSNPNRPDALKMVATPGAAGVPVSVVREVIREIRDALPNIHTLEGARTGGAHNIAASRAMGGSVGDVLDAAQQRIKLRRPFLEQP